VMTTDLLASFSMRTPWWVLLGPSQTQGVTDAAQKK
jgi:hypothetical protein